MSRLSWFSCSTGLEPDSGGRAEWEEEKEELNQFTATGLKERKGRHTKVTSESWDEIMVLQLKKKQTQDFQSWDVMTPVGERWKDEWGEWRKAIVRTQSVLCQPKQLHAVVFHLWLQKPPHTSHSFTERGNWNDKSTRKYSLASPWNLFRSSSNLIPQLTFCVPLDFLNGRKITVCDHL